MDSQIAVAKLKAKLKELAWAAWLAFVFGLAFGIAFWWRT
jgi:hypothetical protein